LIRISLSRRFVTGSQAFKTDGEFKAKVAEVFYALGDLLSAQYESRSPDFSVDAQDDSLSVVASGKQFLLSRQGPNRQIWLSSPRNGSVKFEFDTDSGKWIDEKRPSIELNAFVLEDVGHVIGSAQ
jgi:frataxin-like iron-binding protein CyaY